jgi:hypothetical protein
VVLGAGVSRARRLALCLLPALALVVVPARDLGAVPAPPSPDWDPELVVRGDGRSSYRVGLYDRAKASYRFAVQTGRWVVYVPRGFGIDTTSPVGARVGVAYSGARGGVLGDVVVADPAVGSTRPCLQGPHEAFWRLPGRTSSNAAVVVAVDAVVEGEEARFAAYRLTVCPPATAADGEVDFQLDVIASPAARGDYVWRAVFHPTSSSGAAVPPAVEARSLVRLPVRVALSAKRFVARGEPPARRRRVLIAGRVTENGAAPSQGRLDTRQGRYGVSLYRRLTANGPDQYLGDLGVSATGSFRVAVRDRRGIYYRVATRGALTADGRPPPAGLCGRPWLAAGGCVRPGLWWFYVDSAVVRAR